ncbi:hypothetical protein AVEN_246386-1 [Araneus ventricosus]|uniref:Uncharacterized protein n=1 Tax=Araneus ventricosus TaxID=182803 RepID=A0A4Y2R6F4_ARAVE|nr:hypothetical protein AVEN_246386-1 [Araneus ventricosus]
MTRGLETLKDVSINRRHGIVEIILGISQMLVHVNCRKNYIRRGNHVSVSLPRGTNAKTPPQNEICQHETSVTKTTSSEVQDNAYVQFVFDNADHNTRNVDGHRFFHIMGGVQCMTPSSTVQTISCIPRPKIITTEKVVQKFGFIQILTHDCPKNHGLNR